MAVVNGDASNNTLSGTIFNDTIDGLGGADFMSGGAGNDTYYVDNTGDYVSESLIEGLSDKVFSTVSITDLFNGVEELTLLGTANLIGIGNTLNNVITGNSGNNLIDGGAGIDTMAGGAGDDTYYVENIFDVINESFNSGYDRVITTVNFTLSNNVEELEVVGAVSDIGPMGTGNTLGNLITAHEGYNWLAGMAGNDTIYAGSGNDIVWGGVDNDVLYGEEGNDSLYGESGLDTLYGGLGDDTYFVDNLADLAVEQDIELAYTSRDMISSSIDWVLNSLYIEDLTITGTAVNATGHALNNVITGNAGNNLIDGAAGADTLQGAAGDDTYRVDNVLDVIVENVDEGNDLVIASVDYVLSANVEHLTLEGAAISGSGNELGNLLTGNANANTLSGGDGNDTLSGAGGTDLLLGGEGNDSLDGGNGIDTMTGGAGDDTYVLSTAADVVVELLLSGNDLVRSSVSITSLHDNVERLTLTGTDNLNGSGNLLNNYLTGNAGNNLLDGKFGIDTMAGGKGDDTYVVDNLFDVVIEIAGNGTDLVISSVNYTLGADVENLQLTGEMFGIGPAGNGNTLANLMTAGDGNNLMYGKSGNDTLSGGGGSDSLFGDAGDDSLLGGAGDDSLAGGNGNDTLSGGAGKDTLAGGANDDTYVLTDARDVVTESANNGTDTVQSSVTHALSANVEVLQLTGSASVSGRGNDLANSITGNGASNYLQGRAGNDTLSGGAGNDKLEGDEGNDFLTGGNGADIFRFDVALNAATNVDHITDFDAADGDRIDLGVFTFAELSFGVLDASAFHAGTAAETADQRVIYDQGNGNLYYDADGNGADVQILFAVLGNNAVLTAADFTVS